MPGATRKEIKDALFALGQAATFATAVAGVTTWKISSRRLQLWTKVDPSNQPAMFMVQHREDYINPGAGMPAKRYLEMGFWCYARTDDESILGDDLLDYMETALETALKPDDTPRGELTLGDKVYWVRIWRRDNMFIREPGDMDGQALLILPVRILLP